MAEPRQVESLLLVVGALFNWLAEQKVQGLVIGGVAASLLGRPRATRDVDALVMLDEGRWQAFLAAGAAHGFLPRLADALEFAQRARVLLVRHDATGIDVDISFGALAFEEEVVARAQSVTIGGVTFRLPTAEDLIIMKAVAHRPRDMADIAAVLDLNPQLDLRRIRQWVREFATALAMPEIFTELQALLRRRRS